MARNLIGKEESILLALLQESAASVQPLSNKVDEEHQNEIGFVLTYFLKTKLAESTNFPTRKIWLDFVDWQSLVWQSAEIIKGNGEIWWGWRHDASQTFSGDFYCELILNSNNRVSYLFKIQINGKQYNLESRTNPESSIVS